ncbi:UNVERIFIED_CONTAM: Transcription factor [Sesamum calycinum]|uniref:Transcription factor n=1 Tax=Sesamum calycinum TaxID=2727403 RepID=A0AAW2MDQ3_9LAMI
MRIAVARKKYQKVKELGKINMNVGSIAFYQLMQVRQLPFSEAVDLFFVELVHKPHALMHSDQPYFPRKPMPHGDQVGYYMQNLPMTSVFSGFVLPGVKPLMPFSNVDIQPSDACPRNFIIFDQTNNRSQIMFHPEINSKFFCPGLGVDTSILRENVEQKDSNDDRKVATSSKRDSDDIDALLSTEYEENEECDDDDEVSTARTGAVYECSSPDSCSNYESPSKKSRTFLRKSSGDRGSEKKRGE